MFFLKNQCCTYVCTRSPVHKSMHGWCPAGLTSIGADGNRACGEEESAGAWPAGLPQLEPGQLGVGLRVISRWTLSPIGVRGPIRGRVSHGEGLWAVGQLAPSGIANGRALDVITSGISSWKRGKGRLASQLHPGLVWGGSDQRQNWLGVEPWANVGG